MNDREIRLLRMCEKSNANLTTPELLEQAYRLCERLERDNLESHSPPLRVQALAMIWEMIERVKEETLGILFRIQVAEQEQIDDFRQPKEQNFTMSHGDNSDKKQPVKREGGKVGRNAPCPCGSGKKYKKCCGT